MGYVNDVTARIIGAKDPSLRNVWDPVARNGIYTVSGPDVDAYRDDMVGAQAHCDAVFADIPAEQGTLAAIVTPSVSTPFVVNETNINEHIEEKKRASVLGRLPTSRAMLEAGHIVIVAAPKDAWDHIETNSKGPVWHDLNNRYDNLHGVTVDLPKGVTGAVNLVMDFDVGTEFTGINFPQAQKGTDMDVSGFLFGGNAVNPEVLKQAQTLFAPLRSSDVSDMIPTFGR